jgi:dephospho-CoA kinase
VLLVGLTGGIATGKSQVAAILRGWGVPVIDADLVAREVVAPGTAGLAEIAAAFGDDVLAADGSLDRPRMRARIASDVDARKRLESITHPKIREATALWLAERMAEGAEAAVVEAALLVETGQAGMYPVLLVVTCRPETQLARLMARDGMTEEGAKALIGAQMPLAEKERVATQVIRNDGTPAEFEAAVERAWRAIRPAAGS